MADLKRYVSTIEVSEVAEPEGVVKSHLNVDSADGCV